jgi:hypothetical protein
MDSRKLVPALLLIASSFAVGTPVWAESDRVDNYMPALFGKHDKSLAVLIEMPESKKDFQQAVKCQAKVAANGRIIANACFNGEKKFHRAIFKASESATVNPASINDDAKSVYLLYTVIFVKKDGTERVIVVPNHSTNLKEFGLAYVAPQRLVYKKQEYNLQCPDQPFYHLLTASIDSAGTISNVELSDRDRKCVKCRRCVEKVAGMSSFIPGFVKSQPTTMLYQEPFYQGDRYLAGYRSVNANERPSNASVDAVH